MNAPDLHTRILAAPAAAAAGERPLVDSFRVLAAHDRAVCGGEPQPWPAAWGNIGAKGDKTIDAGGQQHLNDLAPPDCGRC